MSDVASWVVGATQAVVETARGRVCRPTATYRVQFEPEKMTFRAAAEIVPYLAELGVSHLYASPYLKCCSGSPHGYAIVDYSRLNPELGDEDDYRAMIDALHANAMGHILDVVPNHMSATPLENGWWNDVLENGPGSPHAAYFDIDWRPVKEELRDKVLLPILAEQYGLALESGKLTLEYLDGAFMLRHYGTHLPIDPKSYGTILTLGLEAFKESQPADSEDLRELESIVTAIEHLPERTETKPDKVAERQREKEVVKTRLRALVERSPEVAEFIDRNIRELNGTPDDPQSYDALDRLLDAQVYRLSHWKAAANEINYRRFFDINDLAAICMESPQVFAESHRLVFDLLARGDVDGLRVDHIDGLYDPGEYLRRLQRGYLMALGKSLHQQATETAAPDDAPPEWHEVESSLLAHLTETIVANRHALPLYVLVEKILGSDETLPDDWLLAGTSGYDFQASAGRLFVDASGLIQLGRVYRRFIDQKLDFREVAYQSKLLILRTAMSSELQMLAHRLNRISERNRRSRDFTLNELRVALREILACFPVYRTYIREGCVSERDQEVVCQAVAQARRRNPATDAAVFDFIRNVILLEGPRELDEAGRRERTLFVGRVQQTSSPVVAKGIEDTAFYRYFPLASLNEVGGDPSLAIPTPEDFHRQNAERQAALPLALVATTTHDSKRSEDVRARINVLSEIPLLWRKALSRWAILNRKHHRKIDGRPAPSRNDEYLFYQTLVGVWPLGDPRGQEVHDLAVRVAAYMEKATREAKLHTSWINPDSEYDAAVREFTFAALDDNPKNRFLEDFRQFNAQVVNWGLCAALSRVLLKLTVPGVPDTYQGQELWDFSLVDPDNRRPVDFEKRRALLAEIRQEVGDNPEALAALARRLAFDLHNPKTKLFVTWKALQFRRQYAELFQFSNYVPLSVEGPKARHLCAFARRWPAPPSAGPASAVVVVPRLLAGLATAENAAVPPLGHEVWQDTQIVLEGGTSALVNILTGKACPLANSRISAADALADFPVALLAYQTQEG